MPRTAIKSQVLADFMTDWTPSGTDRSAKSEATFWEMTCDEAYCGLGAEAAAILSLPSGIKLRYANRIEFSGCTNNEAEYDGLLLGLRKARDVGARRLLIKTDSEVIEGHVGKAYKAKGPEMQKYLKAVRSMEKYFLGFSVKSMPRAKNAEADELAKAAAQSSPLPLDVFYEVLKYHSIDCDEAPMKFINAIASKDWRAQIIAFLKGFFEPKTNTEKKACRIESVVICYDRRRSIQERCLRPTAKMHII